MLTGKTVGKLDVQRFFETIGKIQGEKSNAVVTVKSIRRKGELHKNQTDMGKAGAAGWEIGRPGF